MRETISAAVLVLAVVLSAQTACSGGGGGGGLPQPACDEGTTQPCFTGPPEVRGVGACADGVLTCVAGQWSEDCAGEVLPAEEACDGGGVDEDCDGSVDEGLQNTSPACATTLDTSIPALSGDSGSAYQEVSGHSERWFRVRFTEDDNAIDDLSGALLFYSPPGADFDVYVYCAACGGTVATYSYAGGFDGHYEYLTLRASDDWGFTDSFNAIVEIRYYDAAACAPWTLAIWGNKVYPDSPTGWCN